MFKLCNKEAIKHISHMGKTHTSWKIKRLRELILEITNLIHQAIERWQEKEAYISNQVLYMHNI
jgi:hypothetical protein